MGRKQAGLALREAIERSNALHATYAGSGETLERYDRFVELQLDYFLPLYDDLRDRKGYSDAIDFVVSDLTGTGIAGRDRELEKVAGLMSRFLPASALDALALAMTLNARVLEINLAIAATLLPALEEGTGISERDYCMASRQNASMTDFHELIGMTRAAGEHLAGIVRLPMIRSLLRSMRLPARMAGVSDLHLFLERGFETFTAVDDVSDFLDTMQSRMQEVFWRVFEVPASSLDTTPIHSRHA